MPQAPSPPSDFHPVATAKHLLRTIRAGALATLGAEGGFPFASLVTVATDLDGSPLLLMSRLAAQSAVEHLNADHREALALYATRLAGEPSADWRATGVDPEGIDLAAGDRSARIAFPDRIDGPGALRAVLKTLADEARARG